MRPFVLALIGFYVAAATAEPPQPNCSKAFNLTPRATVREVEGLKFPQLSFEGGELTATYEPPSQWRTSSRCPSELKLYPPQFAQAYAAVEWLKSSGPVRNDENGIEEMKQEMLKTVPKDSQEIVIVSAKANPIRIGGDTCEITADFTSFGERFRMSTLFVDAGPVQLRFRLSARVADFPEIHPLFHASLYTWQSKVQAPPPSSLPIVAEEVAAEKTEPARTAAGGNAGYRIAPLGPRLTPRL